VASGDSGTAWEGPPGLGATMVMVAMASVVERRDLGATMSGREIW
jgi:hypothetical protein